MKMRIAVVAALIAGSAASAYAQTSIGSGWAFTCKNGQQVYDGSGTPPTAGGSCRGDAAPGGTTSTADAVKMFSDGLMAFLNASNAAAARQAQERAARKRAALDTLRRHQQEALQRQDVVRAQQLAAVEQRLARSNLTFKGMTGAGSSLGLRLEGSGGLELKIGDAATGSLRAQASPAPAPGSDEEAIGQLFGQLPPDAQKKLLD